MQLKEIINNKFTYIFVIQLIYETISLNKHILIQFSYAHIDKYLTHTHTHIFSPINANIGIFSIYKIQIKINDKMVNYILTNANKFENI